MAQICYDNLNAQARERVDDVSEAIAFVTDVLAGDNEAQQRMIDLLEQHDFLPIVEERLGAAGYRAAAVLNRVLG